MISVGNMMAAALVMLKFQVRCRLFAIGRIPVEFFLQQQVFYRPDFASPGYLVRCRDHYVKFLNLLAKLCKGGKVSQSLCVVILHPPYFAVQKVTMVPTPGIDVW